MGLHLTATGRSGSRKKYLGGLASSSFGRQQRAEAEVYCVQLSSIKQLMYRNYPENWGLGKI